MGTLRLTFGSGPFARETGRNAADGTYVLMEYGRSLREADGIENRPDNCPLPANGAGGDNDGFNDDVETHVGTSPEVPCGSSGWPADIISTGSSTNDIDVYDLGSFLAPVRYFNTHVGTHPGDVRWDVCPDAGMFTKDIDVQDLVAIIILTPPILNDVRAFNGPPCPYP